MQKSQLMGWKEDLQRKLTTAEEVAATVQSGDRIGVGGDTEFQHL